jgi:hypothetical protein
MALSSRAAGGYDALGADIVGALDALRALDALEAAGGDDAPDAWEAGDVGEWCDRSFAHGGVAGAGVVDRPGVSLLRLLPTSKACPLPTCKAAAKAMPVRREKATRFGNLIRASTPPPSFVTEGPAVSATPKPPPPTNKRRRSSGTYGGRYVDDSYHDLLEKPSRSTAADAQQRGTEQHSSGSDSGSAPRGQHAT